MTKEEKEKILQEMEHLIRGELSADMYYNDGIEWGVNRCKDIVENMPIAEPKETNLEHYYNEIVELTISNNSDGHHALGLAIKKVYVKYTNKFGVNLNDMLKWYSSPYEKPKYKLTQFEYDLLRTNDMSHDRKVGSFATYVNMKEVGYFKDIDFNLTIKDVLENCEVVEWFYL